MSSYVIVSFLDNLILVAYTLSANQIGAFETGWGRCGREGQVQDLPLQPDLDAPQSNSSKDDDREQ